MSIEALLRACAENDCLAVEKLLAAGRNINETGDVEYSLGKQGSRQLKIKGTSPILEALSHNHLELAEYLISKGANLAHITTDGYQATHLAGLLGSIEALAWLILKRDFDPKQEDNHKYSVFDAIKIGGCKEFPPYEILRNFSMILLASTLKKDFVGLCKAITIMEDQGNFSRAERFFTAPTPYVRNKEEHLCLIKYMVEYAGHDGIETMINERCKLYMFSCLSYVSMVSEYDYVKDYFEDYLAKKNGEEPTPAAASLASS